MGLPEQIDRGVLRNYIDRYARNSAKKNKRRYLRRKYRHNEWLYLYEINPEDVIDEVPPINKCYGGWVM